MENKDNYIKLINDFILSLLNDSKVNEEMNKFLTQSEKDKIEEYKKSNNSVVAPVSSSDISINDVKTENIETDATKINVAPAPEAPAAPQYYTSSAPAAAPQVLNTEPDPGFIDPLEQQAKEQRKLQNVAFLEGGLSPILDLRTIIDFKKFFKKLVQDVYYNTYDPKAPASSIVRDGIKENNKYKLFLGGVDAKNIYECWNDGNLIIKYAKFGIINYQCLKYNFLIDNAKYRNKKRLEDDVKNNKDAMAKYIKWIYENFKFPQMKKFIGSTASLFNYTVATPEKPTNAELEALFSYYLLKQFFKNNNNEYLKQDLYKTIEYKPLDRKPISINLLNAVSKPELHFDQMIANRYTNTSKSFSPSDLSNVLGMMNFQEQLKKQVGGGQTGGAHLYKHIFDNLTHKLEGYKIKINHADEAAINDYITALEANEQKIIDSLETIKKFTFDKNINEYKGSIVSVDDMYAEIMKNKKDSAEKEEKLIHFITKLNQWIKEHFNE